MKVFKRIFTLLAVLSLMSCAVAQTKDLRSDDVPRFRQTAGSSATVWGSEPNPVVEVVRQVRQSVVQIKVESKVTVQNFRNPFFDDDFFRYFFPQQPRETQRPVTSMGSGFVYEYNPQTREAFIMTNNHVVEKGKEGTITVTLADKVNYTATVVGLDPNTDVAVIKITVKEGEKITIAPLGDSANLEIGSWAIAIGNPFGDVGLDRTVTLGVISAIGRSNLNFGSNSPIYQDYIQTDAAINPGNSGGPLLNLRGEVVGVNAAIASASGGFEGIGFAIPSNMATHISRELIARGKVERGWLGVSVQDLTHDLSRTMGLEATRGALVSEVHKASPAEKAGLRQGDVVIAYNGREIRDASQLRNEAASSPIGGEVRLTILREGQKREVPVRIESMESRTLAATPSIQERLGITVRGATAREASRLKLKPGQGVIITRVEPAGPGAKAGLEPGDAILEVNEIPLSSAQDLSGALALVKPGEQILATIMDGRTRQRGSLQIRLR